MTSSLGASVIRGWMQSNNLGSLLSENGGQFGCSDSWVKSFFQRHKLAERTGGHDAQTLPSNHEELTDRTSYQLASLVSMYNIPPQLVFAADQMGMKLLSTNGKTRITRGTKSVGTIGQDDKRQITVVPVVTAAGKLVTTQLIFAGKTSKCHPTQSNTDLLYSHSPSHWTTVETQKELVNLVAKKAAVIKAELRYSLLYFLRF